jgi:hypothetical protein
VFRLFSIGIQRAEHAGQEGCVMTDKEIPRQATSPGSPGTKGAAPDAGQPANAPSPAALTAGELSTLRAVVGRVIPADDLGPGAAEADVHIFIDRSLAGPNAADLATYQAGLAALENAAETGGFANATPAAMDALLAKAEAGTLDGVPAGFFALLLELTRQGMFGDPVYGGNRDFVGWDLIGYPGIKLEWTAAEQEIDAEVAPKHVSVARYGGQGW